MNKKVQEFWRPGVSGNQCRTEAVLIEDFRDLVVRSVPNHPLQRKACYRTLHCLAF